MSHAALTDIVPHLPLTAAYPPSDLLFFCDHEWPTARPCEPGGWAACSGCGLQFAPCTATPIDVRAVMTRTWRCAACSEGKA